MMEGRGLCQWKVLIEVYLFSLFIHTDSICEDLFCASLRNYNFMAVIIQWIKEK